MRITGPQNIAPVKGVKQKKTSTQGSGFAQTIEEQAETTAAQSSRNSAPIGSIDSMLFIQGVDPDQSQRQAAVKDAGAVIDALEQVRRGILLGAIPIGRLKQLSSGLQARLEHSSDPALNDIMTDIVLRARVELAKAGIYK